MRWRRTACAVALVVVSCSGDGAPPAIDRTGSELVRDEATLSTTTPPDAYAVTYRVEQIVDGDVRVRTASLTVQRPFRSRLEIRNGDDTISVRVADLTYLGEQDAGGHRSVRTPAPQPAPGDVRGDLLEDDEADEVRRVAETRCAVHRLGASLSDGEVVPGDTVDACVDGHGLVLEEVTMKGREIVKRWLATEVDLSPDVEDGLFTFAGVEPVPAAEGGGSAQRVDPASAPPGTFWQLDGPLAGFALLGRYAIVPPQTADPDDAKTRAEVIAGVSDVWVHGRDVVIVEQGGTLGRIPPFGTKPYSDLVDVGELASSAESFRIASGAEVRALLPPGRYVTVRGSLRPAAVVAIATRLHPIEGTGLRYL